MDGLTEQQQRFVAEFVSNGGNGKQACVSAGYAAKSAHQEAYRLLRKPHVLDAVRKEQARVLGTMSAKALHVLDQLLGDTEISPAVRLDAAKTVLDRAGYVSARTPAHAIGSNDQPLNEMTPDELRAFLVAIEAVKAQQPVTAGTARAGSASSDWR
jgi:phage terminase small subunit